MSLASTPRAQGPREAQLSPDDAGATRAQRSLAQNLLLEHELLMIARRFADEGIELVILKGVPLTRRLHPSLDRRFSVDNDLLVRRAQAAQAVALMEQLGYASLAGHSLQGDLTSTFQHPMRRSAPGGVTLRAELHWHAFPPQLFDVPEDDLWRHLEPFVIRGQELWVFDAPMTLLHLASHYVQHRCVEAKVLRDVGAAWQRLGAQVDRDELVELGERYGLGAALAFSITSAQQAGLCSADPPFGSLRARLLAACMPAASDGMAPSYGAIFGSLLLASPSRVPRALLYELFPPLPVLARVYQAEPSAWLFARYPARLLRPLKALLGRHPPG